MYSPFLPPCCVLLPSCSLLLSVANTHPNCIIIIYYVLQCPLPLWSQGSFPAYSPSSQLVPSHSPCSLLATLSTLSLLLLPLPPNGQTREVVCYTIFRGSHHLCGVKGWDRSEREQGEWERSERSKRGVREEPEGARGVRGDEGSKRGVRGAREEWGSKRGPRGVRGSEGSEMNVILGFKAPTTIAGKKFDDDI